MLELAPRRLFNFLRQEGHLFEGGTYFVYQFLASKWYYLYSYLTQTAPHKNSKNVIENYILGNLKRLGAKFYKELNKVKPLCAHMDISIKEMRSNPYGFEEN